MMLMLSILAFALSPHLINCIADFIPEAACVKQDGVGSDVNLLSVLMLQTSLQPLENTSEELHPRAMQNVTTETMRLHQATSLVKMESHQVPDRTKFDKLASQLTEAATKHIVTRIFMSLAIIAVCPALVAFFFVQVHARRPSRLTVVGHLLHSDV
jgi:hypothetical protein